MLGSTNPNTSLSPLGDQQNRCARVRRYGYLVGPDGLHCGLASEHRAADHPHRALRGGEIMHRALQLGPLAAIDAMLLRHGVGQDEGGLHGRDTSREVTALGVVGILGPRTFRPRRIGAEASRAAGSLGEGVLFGPPISTSNATSSMTA